MFLTAANSEDSTLCIFVDTQAKIDLVEHVFVANDIPFMHYFIRQSRYSLAVDKSDLVKVQTLLEDIKTSVSSMLDELKPLVNNV